MAFHGYLQIQPFMTVLCVSHLRKKKKDKDKEKSRDKEKDKEKESEETEKGLFCLTFCC